MSTGTPDELRERLARIHRPSANGDEGAADTAAPASDDLDWFLFRSFPECEVSPALFAELVPVYEKALRAGARFDHELLYVRTLELVDQVGIEAVRRIARAALERTLAGGFDPADAVAALRFALRTLPADEPFLDDVLGRPSLAGLRFQWTLDFVLDERDVAEYLALSYLRDDDPDTAGLLARFPVPPARLDRLARFFEADACRRRLAVGWEEHTAPEERHGLAAQIAERLPGFAPGKGSAASPGGGS